MLYFLLSIFLWMDWMDEQMDRLCRMNGWAGWQMDEWADGWMDVQVGRWMDRQVGR